MNGPGRPRKLGQLVDSAMAIALPAKLAEGKRQQLGPKRHKPTARYYCQLCLEVADSTEERLESLRKLVSGDRWGPLLREVIGRMVSLMKDPYIHHPLNPTQIMRCFSVVDGSELTLLQSGYSRDELMCLAAHITAETNPDSFGPVKDFEGEKKAADELKAKLDSIYAQIREVVTLDDVTEDHEGLSDWQRDHGLSRWRLKAWPDICLSPRASLGERIIGHLLTKEFEPPPETPAWAQTIPADPERRPTLWNVM